MNSCFYKYINSINLSSYIFLHFFIVLLVHVAFNFNIIEFCFHYALFD